jgi:hypothetical protein
MASTKKDKGAAAPEASKCDNCAAPEGQNGVTLKECAKCKLIRRIERALARKDPLRNTPGAREHMKECTEQHSSISMTRTQRSK